MNKLFDDIRRPASDSGSEDVFMDLAQSDDEPEQPSSRAPQTLQSLQPTNLQDESSSDSATRTLPGRFPDRIGGIESAESRRRTPAYAASSIGPPTRTWGGATRQRHGSHGEAPPSAYLNSLSASRANRPSTAGNPSTGGRIAEMTSDSYADSRPLRREKRLVVGQDGHTESGTANGHERYRGARRPSLNQDGPMLPSPSAAVNNGPPNDSDSMDSPTAASTVWDELDDLKSRIRKLESSGRVPSTSNAAIARHTGARPQTATTEPTTVSISPRQAKKQAVAPSEVGVAPSVPMDIHPTLQSALQRARGLLKPQVFRPLEAAVSDALALAVTAAKQNTLAHISGAASTVNGYGTTDRQTRRRVDGLCRNLTDLCIAMCDARNDETPAQSSPVSARKPASPRHYLRASLDREDDAVSQAPSQAPSHFQSRRGSNTARSRLEKYRGPRRVSVTAQQDVQDESAGAQSSPSTTPRDYTKRYSAIMRADPADMDRQYLSPVTVSPETEVTAEDQQQQQQQPRRAPSRATTELGSGRTSMGLLGRRESRLRSSGTTTAQRSPSLRETLEARRRSANMSSSAFLAAHEEQLAQLGSSSSQQEVQSAVVGGGGATGQLQTPLHQQGTRYFSDRVRSAASEVGGFTASRPRTSAAGLTVRAGEGGAPGGYGLPSPRLDSAVGRTTSLGRRRLVTE